MNKNLPKICDASTSSVLKCENTDCQYNIKHYDYIKDWLIVHPRNVKCEEMNNK